MNDALLLSIANMGENPTNDTLLSTKQVAERYGFSVAWLEHKRWERTGPKFIKIGRMIKYRVSDIAEYISSHVVTTIAS